jgi:hypothetical protein
LIVQNRPLERRERHAIAGERRLSREQLIEHRAELIDVGERRGRTASNLFGRCILGRHPTPRRPRDRTRGARWQRILGESEVEQLHRTVAIHQDVRRFQVAMDDEIAMGVLRRLAYRQKQAHAVFDARTAVVEVDIDRLTVDVLEHEIG